MNKKLVSLFLLVAGFAMAGQAQSKESPKTSKEKTITIRKKGDSKEKMTIVVDGDKVTVNGKPLEELKDSDVEVFQNDHLRELMPQIRKHLAPLGSLKMMGDDFPFATNRAFLGVTTEKNGKGARITSVEKETAAEKMGLQKDDIITKVGDSTIEGSEGLFEAIGKYKPEDKVNITYLRDGKSHTATATLGKSKMSKVQAFRIDGDHFRFNMPDMPRLNDRNFRFDFNDSRKPRLGLGIQDLAEGKGVKVLNVDEDTPAAKAGLQKDDIITGIDDTAVNSVDELKGKIKDLKEGSSLTLTFLRSGKTQSATVTLPKKLKTAEL